MMPAPVRLLLAAAAAHLACAQKELQTGDTAVERQHITQGVQPPQCLADEAANLPGVRGSVTALVWAAGHRM